jgi:hypothetical protein
VAVRCRGGRLGGSAALVGTPHDAPLRERGERSVRPIRRAGISFVRLAPQRRRLARIIGPSLADYDARRLEPEPNAEPRTVPAPTVVRVAVPAAAIVGIAEPARTSPTAPAPTPTPPTAAPASRFRRCARCSGYSGRQTGYADCGSDRRSHRADAPKDRDSHGRNSSG